VTTATRPRAEPELDAEQEVDLGRYAHALAVRWWLLLAGLVVGAIIGYLIALGGSQLFKATSTVYLGQPYSIISATALQGPQTNPATVGTIVHSEAAIDQAAAAAGMPASALRGHISTKSLSTGTSAVTATKAAVNPLVAISVQATTRHRARLATNSLADQVVQKLSAFTNEKIAGYQKRIANDQAAIDAARRQSSGGQLGALIALQIYPVLQDQIQAQGLLAQAKDIERPEVLTRGAATRVTARSRRNSTVVGAFLGLVIGLIAALAWEPVAARRRR
jgi:capsular polysaccharide biosynthesis protein